MQVLTNGVVSYDVNDFANKKNIIIFDHDGEVDYDIMTFSGGEEHVRIDSIDRDGVGILANIKTSRDIMCLLLATDALKRMGAKKVSLTMPYIPYARQDRVCNYGEALSIKVFADLINAQNYDSVAVYDPHSDVSIALFNNLEVIEQHVTARRHVKEGMIIVSPDAGAMKKCQKLANVTGNQLVCAGKIRDTATGEITGTRIYDDGVELFDKDVIIVDDICDGGRTFIELAKVLRDHNVKSVSLYVTHGIFSKGLGVFDGIIDNIYTAY